MTRAKSAYRAGLRRLEGLEVGVKIFERYREVAARQLAQGALDFGGVI